MKPSNVASDQNSTKITQSEIAPEEFLTTKELMQLLKIRHKQTIYSLIEEGMPAVSVGRNYRFIRQEVIHYLKEHSSGKENINH